MAGKKRVSGTSAPTLDAEFWRRFTADENPPIKAKLLYLTMAEISRRGILDVNAAEICGLLEVKPPMVNYYFGSFDGLLAAAVAQCYEDWLIWIAKAVTKPVKSPRARLRNVLEGEVERAQYYGGIIVFSAYPNMSEMVTAELDRSYRDRLEQVMKYVLAVLAVLIRDLKTGTCTPIDFTVDTIPATRMQATHLRELVAAASVMWSISGLSLWSTGQDPATRGIAKLAGQLVQDRAMKQHIDRILDSLAADFARD